MEPTISAGDNLIATPVFFHPEIPFTGISFPGIRNPRRGEIILYKPSFYSEMPWYIKVPDSIIRFFTIQKKGFPGYEDTWSNSLMMKRVIGIPGDTIKFENNEVLIKPAGKSYFFSEKEILQAEYTITRYPVPDNWPEDFPFAGNMDEISLGEDQYFLLGDNRSMSNDSYYQGPVDKKNITAKVILKYVPSIEIPQ